MMIQYHYQNFLFSSNLNELNTLIGVVFSTLFFLKRPLLEVFSLLFDFVTEGDLERFEWNFVLDLESVYYNSYSNEFIRYLFFLS